MSSVFDLDGLESATVPNGVDFVLPNGFEVSILPNLTEDPSDGSVVPSGSVYFPKILSDEESFVEVEAKGFPPVNGLEAVIPPNGLDVSLARLDLPTSCKLKKKREK